MSLVRCYRCLLTIHAFSRCCGLKSIAIPDSVTSLGRYVFDSCSGLSSVDLPNGVTAIPYYAFANCTGLKSITIPNSVASIDTYAFYGSYNLETAVVDWGVPESVYAGKFSANIKRRVLNVDFTPATRTIISNRQGIVLGIEGCDSVPEFRYTLDGTDPSETSTLYSGKFSIKGKTVVKVVAYYNGECVSDVFMAEYGLGIVSNPVITCENADFMESNNLVSITCDTDDVEIRYTTDGSEPNGNSLLYVDPFEISETTTINAKAMGHADYLDSEVVSMTFVRNYYTVDCPTIQSSNGVNFSGVEGSQIVLSCVTEDSELYYTIDGSDPSVDGVKYDGTFY